MRRNSSITKSALLAAIIIIMAVSMVFIMSMQGNTDVRSRAADPYPDPIGASGVTGGQQDKCREAFSNGGSEAPPEGCGSYFQKLSDNCEIGFREDGFIPEGCGVYTDKREDDCRSLALDGIGGEGCGAYLDREPITLQERICNVSPDLPLVCE